MRTLLSRARRVAFCLGFRAGIGRARYSNMRAVSESGRSVSGYFIPTFPFTTIRIYPLNLKNIRIVGIFEYFRKMSTCSLLLGSSMLMPKPKAQPKVKAHLAGTGTLNYFASAWGQKRSLAIFQQYSHSEFREACNDSVPVSGSTFQTSGMPERL